MILHRSCAFVLGTPRLLCLRVCTMLLPFRPSRILHVSVYLYNRFFSMEWERSEVCAWILCGSVQTISLNANFNLLLFLGKALLGYARGRSIAVLATSFRLVSDRIESEPTQEESRNAYSGHCIGCVRKPQTRFADAKESIDNGTMVFAISLHRKPRPVWQE